MPAYTTAAAAVALDVHVKWVDNVLSHHQLPGVEAGGTQGVGRKITPAGVAALAIVLRLTRELGIPVRRAVEIAGEVSSGSLAEYSVAPHLALVTDLEGLERELATRLREAAEIVVPPRRGRPPRA